MWYCTFEQSRARTYHDDDQCTTENAETRLRGTGGTRLYLYNIYAPYTHDHHRHDYPAI